jgi:hypothetical protein
MITANVKGGACLLKKTKRMAAVCMSVKADIQGVWRESRKNRLIMLIAAAAVAAIFALPLERLMAFLQVNP